jgi:rhodanese-related sulfurtransferase
VFVAGTLAFGFNALRENSLPLWKTAEVADRSSSPSAIPDESATLVEMSIEEAVGLFERQAAIFVDARSADSFRAGHIEGAVNLPDQSFENHITSFLDKTPPETVLITYCEGVSCTLSKSLAEKLALAGFENVFHLEDGWGQWKVRGLPQASGAE